MLPILLLAAQLSSAAPHSESIEVRVLEIEAAVIDREGKPVEGLAKDDFEVKIDGKRQEISNFFAVRRSAIVDETRSADAPAPEAVPPSTTIPTSLVIFVDDTRLHMGSKQRALDALERYVRANVGALTTATLIRYNGSMHVRVRPTERPGHLLTEIENMRREPAMVMFNDRERAGLVSAILRMLSPASTMSGGGDDGGGAASAGGGGKVPNDVVIDHEKTWRDIEMFARREVSDVDRTLEALHDTVRIAGGFEGRKILLYVSEGLPTQPGIELIEFFTRVAAKSPDFSSIAQNSNYNMSEALRHDRTNEFRRFAKEAQRAGVSFYSFDAAGVRTFYIPGTEQIMSPDMPSAQIMRDSDQAGVRLVAAETGGRFLGNDNNFDRVLTTMSEQFTTYYSLGVRQPKGRSVNVRVTVKNRPDLRVIAARRRTAMTRDQQIAQNVKSRLYTRVADNPLQARLEVSAPMKIDKLCVAPVRVDASSLGEVAEIHVAVLNERNDESDVRTTVVPSDGGTLTHSFRLGLQPRKHVLSFAIVDRASGAVSYLQEEVDGSSCK
jgi:VWFA-related protein